MILTWQTVHTCEFITCGLHFGFKSINKPEENYQNFFSFHITPDIPLGILAILLCETSRVTRWTSWPKDDKHVLKHSFQCTKPWYLYPRRAWTHYNTGVRLECNCIVSFCVFSPQTKNKSFTAQLRRKYWENIPPFWGRRGGVKVGVGWKGSL